jgi:PAS domain S-box-containing protein
MSNDHRTKILCSSKQAIHSQELSDYCYRVLLETSSSAILILSPEAIILQWSRGAERVSGWIAEEALGRSYVELCIPIEARESFLTVLTRVTEGSEVKGLEVPLLARAGSQTMLSWNISPVLENHGEVIGLMAIGTSVAQDTQVQKDLQLARREARRIQAATEEERCRIARELHDEFGQALTGLKFDLAWFGKKLTQWPAPTCGRDLLHKVQAMSGSVDALLENVHTTAAALRPPMLEDLGLVAALESLATTFQHRTGMRCTIDVAPDLSSSVALPSETSVALFRIAQELLTNVTRHAAASLVHVQLYQDDARVTLEITDNGKGITQERMNTPHSFGLRGIQERASLLGGHFQIAGACGIGTKACVSLPFAECLAHD